MTETIDARLVELLAHRWHDNKSIQSQARIAVEGLIVASGGYRRVPSEYAKADVQRVTTTWRTQGMAPWTINKRLNCLSALGVTVQRVKVPNKLKWWLKPEMQARLTKTLREGLLVRDGQLMADYIEFVSLVGLRVEEALRLSVSDVSGYASKLSITVPGLKTSSSQATLPLSAPAGAILMRRWQRAAEDPQGLFFAVSYISLKRMWQSCRTHMGVRSDPLATLKAIRRSAARYLHLERKMPLDAVRQYLRHEDISTTMSYLRLTGGIGTEEMRQWL